MIEHRLIERMIGVVREMLPLVARERAIDPRFVDLAVDFIRTYADRTHHGKEEDIMFRTLAARALSAEDRRVMEELVAEHRFGRETTAALVDANERYRRGDASAIGDVERQLATLADFYPRHIAKEDRVFFPAARAYLSEEEDRAMLGAFLEFDRGMIHEKYREVVRSLGGG